MLQDKETRFSRQNNNPIRYLKTGPYSDHFTYPVMALHVPTGIFEVGTKRNACD